MPRLASLTQQALTGLSVVSGAANLLSNGDFSLLDFTNWTLTNDVSSSASTGAAEITGGATPATLSQTILVDEFTAYKLEYDITEFTDLGGASVSLIVTSSSDGVIVTQSISATSIDSRVLFYTSDTEVSVQVSVSNATISIDNVFIGEAVEAYEYTLVNSADPTNTTWRSTLAPAGYIYVPNNGIYSFEPIEDATGMFQSSSTVGTGVENWDTSTITNMNRMFQNAVNFTGNVTSWDTSNVINMDSMFRSATSFSRSIGVWNVSSVQNMDNMFRLANQFDQDISNWNTTNLIQANGFSVDAALKGANWTVAEHPRMRIRSVFGTVVGVSNSFTTQVVCDDTAANLPATPFTMTGQFSNITVTVTGTGANDAGQTVLNFASTPNNWFLGEPLLIELFDL